MAIHVQLQRFVDDELLRAPLLFEQVVEAALKQARKDPALVGRSPAPVINEQRGEMARRFVASLREQTSAGLGGARPRAAPKTLALLDDEAVAADVELSRAVAAIASVAEYELRELGAFTSALVGDHDVARDTNPLSADVYARALDAAAQALPLSRGTRVAFMRHAAMPLAQVLRRAYAAACTRLEDAGVEPGLHRTIVFPPGTRGAERAPALADVRDSMPMPLDEPPPGAPPIEDVLGHVDALLRRLPADADRAARAQALDSQRMRLLDSAGSRADAQVIELVSRLFDAVLTDPAIAAGAQVLLSRLHPSVLRVALSDPATLDSYEHPVWRLVDLVADLGDTPDDGQARVLAFLQALVDHLVREPVHDANLFIWGVQRLEALQRQRFEQQRRAAAAQIAALQQAQGHRDDRGGPGDAGDHGAMDVGGLETVPAELLDLQAPSAPKSSAALDALSPGQALRVFRGGRWRQTQLLWTDPLHGLWLLADVADGSSWALARSAVERLHAEGLLLEARAPSVVRRAAETVLRAAAPKP